MITPIRQTKFGDPDGNCLEACIATITGLELDEIPHFLEEWYLEYEKWLRGRGWLIAWWNAGAGGDPPGLAIANGPSFRGLPHSVVYLDGLLYHDPHPSDAGLVEVRYWILLWREARPAIAPQVAVVGPGVAAAIRAGGTDRFGCPGGASTANAVSLSNRRPLHDPPSPLGLSRARAPG